MRCAVFASGGGSNFQALIEKIESGDLHVEIVLMVGNNSTAGAFEKARKHNIPSVHLASSQYSSPMDYQNHLLALLEQYRVELIVLAGYMKMLPSEVVHRYHNKIVNIHPGLLPAFGGKGMYGKKVHQAVLDYGAKVTGVSVHFVNENYDEGPVICQVPVEVMDTDDCNTLAERVLKVEHQTFWRAIEAIARGKIRVEGRRVTGYA